MDDKYINKSYGSPWDRGASDSYYCRGINPHYWPAGTGFGNRRGMEEMTAEQIQEYLDGYHENEAIGCKKYY